MLSAEAAETAFRSETRTDWQIELLRLSTHECVKSLLESISGGRPPTLREVDDLIGPLEALLRSPGKKEFADEKAARLMLASAYLAKYSVLESPGSTGTKGGPAIRLKAKGEYETLLKARPGDREVLIAYQDLLAGMGVDTYPIARKIVELYPRDSWGTIPIGPTGVSSEEVQPGNSEHGAGHCVRREP